MRTDELDFELPEELIATRPVEPRDAARLLVVSRSDPARLEHRAVRDLPALLAAGDRLVFNRSRVLPARFHGRNLDTGGKVEGLWLRDATESDLATAPPPPESPPAPVSPSDPIAHSPLPIHSPAPLVWVCLLKARRFRPGRRVELHADDGPTGVILTMLAKLHEGEPAEAGEPGAWLVGVEPPDGLPASTPAMLDRAGLTPLPPYILAARKRHHETIPEPADRAWYQTVFAQAGGEPAAADHGASVAAPTAGLHFTPRLLDDLARAGVQRDEVVLHVGAGTFKPIETDTVEAHPMHAEWCSLAGPADRFFAPPEGGGQTGRLVAVGSTATRTLEAYAALIEAGRAAPDWLACDLFIRPGYRWRAVDAMLTNFHLPRSTLLTMVAAFLEPAAGPGTPDHGAASPGLDRLLAIYDQAIRHRYRFFSYGDAMLILP